MTGATINEKYDEQHVRALIVYGNVEDHILYYEPTYETAVSQADVKNAYEKNLLLINDGTNLLRAVSMVENTVSTVGTEIKTETTVVEGVSTDTQTSVPVVVDWQSAAS